MKTFNIEPYYEVQYNEITGECNIISHAYGKERILSQHLNHYGYLATKIFNKVRTIHSIIGENLFGHKEGYSMNHKDGVKTNNALDNLEYITIAENIKHAVSMGLHVAADPKRNGRYKDGRAIKSRISQYKHEWYEKNKNK